MQTTLFISTEFPLSLHRPQVQLVVVSIREVQQQALDSLTSLPDCFFFYQKYAEFSYCLPWKKGEIWLLWNNPSRIYFLLYREILVFCCTVRGGRQALQPKQNFLSGDVFSWGHLILWHCASFWRLSSRCIPNCVEEALLRLQLGNSQRTWDVVSERRGTGRLEHATRNVLSVCFQSGCVASQAGNFIWLKMVCACWVSF